MPVQVIVTKGDRSWDSLKPCADQAMFRVGEHMEQDHDEDVARAGKKVSNHLLFGGTTAECQTYLEGEGFTVQVKGLYKDWNVKWQSGTKSGTVIIRDQIRAEDAAQIAQPALAAISKEHNLMYLNVTVEERTDG